jgi:hypothetical protein
MIASVSASSEFDNLPLFDQQISQLGGHIADVESSSKLVDLASFVKRLNQIKS